MRSKCKGPCIALCALSWVPLGQLGFESSPGFLDTATLGRGRGAQVDEMRVDQGVSKEGVVDVSQDSCLR